MSNTDLITAVEQDQEVFFLHITTKRGPKDLVMTDADGIDKLCASFNKGHDQGLVGCCFTQYAVDSFNLLVTYEPA